jgi:hypothetical protein
VRSSANDNDDCDDSSTSSDTGRASATDKDNSAAKAVAGAEQRLLGDPTPGDRKDPEILISDLMEGIGLALDLKGGRMFITDLAGTVYSANLDGSNKKTLLFLEGNLTGIAYAEI